MSPSRSTLNAVFGLIALGSFPLAVKAEPMAETQAAPSFRVTGTVVSSRDEAPVPFARLHVVEAGTAETRRGPRFGAGRGFDPGRTLAGAAGDSAVADAHGRFQLDLPHAGEWILSGEARGFRRQAFDAHENFSAAIVLTAETRVAKIALRLQPDALLSGAVFDEVGEPVSGAQVFAEAVLSSNPAPGEAGRFGRPGPSSTLTDDRGHFELSGLAPGSYRLVTQAHVWYAPGAGSVRAGQGSNGSSGSSPADGVGLDPSLDVVYPTTWFPGATEQKLGQILDLAGGEALEANFHLQPTPAAHLIVPTPESPGGAVDSRAGRPGVIVRRTEAPGIPDAVPGGRYTGSGWDVGGFAPGTYEVRLAGPAGRNGDQTRKIVVTQGGGQIELSAGVPSVRLRLVFEGSGAFEVSGAEDTGAVEFVDVSSDARFVSGVRGRRAGRPLPGQADQETSEPGVRTIELPPGRYKVALMGTESGYLAGMNVKGATLENDVLTLSENTGSEVLPTLTLHMEAGRGELRGTALLGQEPIEGAIVLAVPALLGQPGNLSEVRRAETNTDGGFYLGGLIPGSYIVVALNQGWNVNWHDPATLAGYLVHGVPANVKSSALVHLSVPAVNP